MTLFIIICVLVGCIGGLLQGMLGVGTGIVAIPLLTFLLPHYGVPQSMAIHIAIATSMGAITVISVAAIIGHHRQQNIQWDIFKKVLFFCMVGSAMGAGIASSLPARILHIVFALFMFFVAFRIFKNKKPNLNAHKERSLSGPVLALGRADFSSQ